MHGLPERLRSLREQRRLTQAQLAEALDSSQQRIQHYEAGTRTPSIEFVDRLAEFFGVSVDYIMGRTDYPYGVDTSYIDAALYKDPSLRKFWEKLKRRPDLQALTEDLAGRSPDSVQRVFAVLRFLDEYDKRPRGR